MRMLTVGSAILAVINIGVMWGMAHKWRYAWHGNLALQLLWLPYDTVTKQYGLLALGGVMTVVSIKGVLYGSQAQSSTEGRSGPRHRRPRRPHREQAVRDDRRLGRRNLRGVLLRRTKPAGELALAQPVHCVDYVIDVDLPGATSERTQDEVDVFAGEVVAPEGVPGGAHVTGRCEAVSNTLGV
jgi:hypothetical protein